LAPVERLDRVFPIILTVPLDVLTRISFEFVDLNSDHVEKKEAASTRSNCNDQRAGYSSALA
jgi:hypothetical protein